MKNVLLKLSKNKLLLVAVIVLLGAIIGLVVMLAMQKPQPKSQPAPVGKNTHIDEYMKANWNSKVARDVPFPARTKLAVLKGSWYEMGQQYGQSFGDYVRIVYDSFYGLFLTSKLDTTKLAGVLDKYMDETEKLSPEMLEFVRGIGDGAAPHLDKADNATALSNTHKIMFINCLFEVVFPPAWPHVAEMMGVEAPEVSTTIEPFASHAWAAWGNMTNTGGGIMGGTRDQPWYPTLYNVTYVAVPSDGRAAKTWSNAIAGLVVASAQVNEHGVGMGNTIVDHQQQYFGVPTLMTTAYISFFAKSAREAADIYTIGTPEYRQKTGRETLAATSGFFQTFADAKEGFVVERTGRNYYVRQKGSQQEPADYIVLSNHSVAGASNDEMKQPTGKPMKDWTRPYPSDSSSYRYWTLFHEMKNNQGNISVEFAQKNIATLKYIYGEDGTRITERDGVPVWRLGLSPERWTIPKPEDPNSLPTGGNNIYFVADLKKRDVYWVQGIPSHWSGPWQHVSLQDESTWK